MADLSEVGESEGDDDGRKRALASTDLVAHVERDLDVAGRGRDDRAVGTASGVRVTKRYVNGRTIEYKRQSKDLPGPRWRNTRWKARSHSISISVDVGARSAIRRLRGNVRSLRQIARGSNNAADDGRPRDCWTGRIGEIRRSRRLSWLCARDGAQRPGWVHGVRC
jgi:hypothetical protein